MHRNPTLHKWMHRNRHPSSKRTRECTEMVTHQVIRQMHQNPTPHIWMHGNRHPSSKCSGIFPLTHECTEIIIPQVHAPESYPSHMSAPESYPSHMNAPKSSIFPWIHQIRTFQIWMHRNHNPSSKCTGILPLTHECTEIVAPLANASKSYA